MTEAIKRPSPKPAPKQARARARQQLILDAAQALVTEGAIDQVTTTGVALKAGIPVGSVYRYFEDRADILDRLYRDAYGHVEGTIATAQASLPSGLAAGEVIRRMLQLWVRTARAHPTYRTLTRWANSHYSLWEVTPGRDSNLIGLIEKTLSDSGVTLGTDRSAAVSKTMVTTLSVLADLSLEADDEREADALVEELATLLEAYVGTFGP